MDPYLLAHAIADLADLRPEDVPDLLQVFTTRELISELRRREVIQGEHWLCLHPTYADVLRLEEARS